jgi:threonine aldolase
LTAASQNYATGHQGEEDIIFHTNPFIAQSVAVRNPTGMDYAVLIHDRAGVISYQAGAKALIVAWFYD